MKNNAAGFVRFMAVAVAAAFVLTVVPMAISGTFSLEALALADDAGDDETLDPIVAPGEAAAASIELEKLNVCSVAIDPSDDASEGDVGESFACDGARTSLSEREVVSLLRAEGFPEQDLSILVCVIKNESSFRPRVQNLNKLDDSYDTGLFQINDLWRDFCQMSRKDLMNPANNVRCAHAIYDERGLNAWYGFTKKKAECRSYRLGTY